MACPPPVISPVLMLIDCLGVGGAERYVVTVANRWAAAGAEIAVLSEVGELAAELAPGIRVVDLPLDRARARVPLLAARVARLLRGRRPAAIVTHSLATTWIARLAAVGTGIPIATVAHGWPEARYRKVAPLLRASDLVVAVSPEVRQKLVGAGLPADRCVVVENGVDCSPLGRREGEVRRAARAAMGAGPDDVLALVVGRLSAQKALQHVPAIAGLLREEQPRLRFAIAGEGECEAALAAAIRAAGLAERVRLLGLRQDVPDLLGSADLYLSCSDWEGMSLAAIEAMASGLPCVATRTEGATRLVAGDCGLLVPVGDVAGLARAVSHLAGDPALRARMGAAGRARALELFGSERVARELMAELERLVRRRGS